MKFRFLVFILLSLSNLAFAESAQSFKAVQKLWHGVRWSKPVAYDGGKNGRGFFVSSKVVSKGHDTVDTFGDTLKKNGWIFVDDLLADGPDGGTVGYKKGKSLLLIESASCPEDMALVGKCSPYSLKFMSDQ